jgi:hypothetical protein
VDEKAIYGEAQKLQRDAVLCYNKQMYAAALAKFQDILQTMQMLFAPGHPEIVKAEKSVQMVQRKLTAEYGTSGSNNGDSNNRPRTGLGYNRY